MSRDHVETVLQSLMTGGGLIGIALFFLGPNVISNTWYNFYAPLYTCAGFVTAVCYLLDGDVFDAVIDVGLAAMVSYWWWNGDDHKKWRRKKRKQLAERIVNVAGRLKVVPPQSG